MKEAERIARIYEEGLDAYIRGIAQAFRNQLIFGEASPDEVIMRRIAIFRKKHERIRKRYLKDSNLPS